MSDRTMEAYALRSWMREKIFLGMTFAEYLKSLITPFNIIVACILCVGIPFYVMRYLQGLIAVMHPSHEYPWGLFICFGLLGTVPLSATGFIMASAVYLFGLKEYKPLVRMAILTGFLGYACAVAFIFTDIGRSWRLYYPMLVSYGPQSILFLVAWHVALYLSTQFVEFCPAIFEWLGADRFRRWALYTTIGATIFGVILSTLHQSALGALFLLMPGKVHPLWYSPYIPVFFFISSIWAGLSMIILVAWICKKAFRGRSDDHFLNRIDNLTVGLGRAASITLFAYFAIKIIGVAHGHHWNLLTTSYGYWFQLEIFGFVLLPCFLFAQGARYRNVGMIRITSIITVVGVILNRLNLSLITFNWNLPHREFPKWTEYIVVLTIFTVFILIFRWMVNRMPVLSEHPEYKEIH